MPQPNETSQYLVSLFAALRALPATDWPRELDARCDDPELRRQVHTMLHDDLGTRAAAHEPTSGMLLNQRYELEALLGQGGSASVWSAHD